MAPYRVFFFDRRYRDLWATPVTVEVLDLDSFGGGLSPLKRGGFGQSINLHFRGADGRRCVFRSLYKELRLAEDLRGIPAWGSFAGNTPTSWE